MELVKDSIIQIKKKIIYVFNSGDAKGVARNYDRKAKFYPPNGNVVQGMEGIEAFWNTTMEKGIKILKLETINIDTSGSTAFEAGNYWLFLGNGQITDFGEYIAIWRNKNDEWKLYLHQLNSNRTLVANTNENLNIRMN